MERELIVERTRAGLEYKAIPSVAVPAVTVTMVAETATENEDQMRIRINISTLRRFYKWAERI